MPRSLQTDIKTFFGSYKQGVEDSMITLFKIGYPNIITTLSESTPFGYHDHQALFIHKSLKDDLNNQRIDFFNHKSESNPQMFRDKEKYSKQFDRVTVFV